MTIVIFKLINYSENQYVLEVIPDGKEYKYIECQFSLSFSLQGEQRQTITDDSQHDDRTLQVLYHVHAFVEKFTTCNHVYLTQHCFHKFNWTNL